ncbi:MAG: NFACT family protein [Firmicutes bacterium]|nr:NFACT family protein [Bacillota bacterium]
MAFDGITTYYVTEELRQMVLGGKIDKIYQTDTDEVVLQIRRPGNVYRLLLSAHGDSARFYLTEQKPETPLEPPMFCMLFRKHFGGGRVADIRQIGFDRILEIRAEVYNELGDPCVKQIILEVMGRHSNLILVDEKGTIIDCVHHVGQTMSHFRTVLPGLPYQAPSHNQRIDPPAVRDYDEFDRAWEGKHNAVGKSMYQVFNGISPFAASEICFRAGVSDRAAYEDLPEEQKNSLYAAFSDYFREMLTEPACPAIFLDGDQMKEYSMISSRMMAGVGSRTFQTPSELLDIYYVRQDNKNRLRQKSQDLHKLVSTNLDRVNRKETLQSRQLAETADRDRYQRAGDLILSNIYRLHAGDEKFEAEDFYEDPPVTREIELNPHLSPSQNAQKYYDKYNKLKRTEEAVTLQLEDTRREAAYLASILDALEMADCEKDLEDIRAELAQTGYLRRSKAKRRNLQASRPLEFTTSEGLMVLVGKNNVQNDQLTFKMATPFDYWFHVKDMPGSHVILFCGDRKLGQDYTEQSILEAAQIAAGHSSLAEDGKVSVDYTQRRYVKKPSGAKPGFVNYTHQKTLVVEPCRHKSQ